MLPVVILISPQLGENIGAAARNMLNFGLSDLRLVNPRDGWPNPKADYMSKNAKKVIDNAQVFNSLQEAAFDVHKIYAATARPRDMVKDVYTSRETASEAFDNYIQGKRCAFMFGPERSGLNNDDISMADVISIIPVSDEYKSLNLAQAVNVFCYEWFVKIDSNNDKQINTDNFTSATKDDIVRMFEHLEFELDRTGFFKNEKMKPKMINNIRNIFSRADLTDQDVRTLRGMIKSLTNRI